MDPGQALQFGQAGIGDPGTDQRQRSQTRERLQPSQPRIADRSVIKPQPVKPVQSFEIVQPRVGDQMRRFQ